MSIVLNNNETGASPTRPPAASTVLSFEGDQNQQNIAERNARDERNAYLAFNQQYNESETRKYINYFIFSHFIILTIPAFVFWTTQNQFMAPALAFFIPAFILVISKLIFRIYIREQNPGAPTCHQRKLMANAACVLDLALLGVLLYKSQGATIAWSYVSIPLLLSTLCRIIGFIYRKSSYSCLRIDDIVEVVLMGTACAQITVVFMKFDSLISWQWNMVFVFYWMLFSFWFIFSIGMIFLVFKQILYRIIGEYDELLFISSIWVALASTTWLVISLMGVLTMIAIQNMDQKAENFINATIFTSIVLLSILILYTGLRRKSLISYFKSVLFEFSGEVDEEIQENPEEANQAQSVKVLKKPVENNIRIKRISTSYFRILMGDTRERPVNRRGLPNRTNSGEKIEIRTPGQITRALSHKILITNPDPILEENQKGIAQDGSPKSNMSDGINCFISVSYTHLTLPTIYSV
eukprot:TRINITY_DN6247_c0_g5_i2.p1 TRINITY_DN6247_c0_g5~~TRINITY_DN6247_c0_g5_i2.p1  ORF type:complete len:467 (-),score=50.12 TRINITY_DN6247_c0_g5_i2:35-1435(-)